MRLPSHSHQEVLRSKAAEEDVGCMEINRFGATKWSRSGKVPKILKAERSSSKLIVLPLDFHIQHRLMIISLPPRLLQLLNFIVIQSPPDLILQLFPADLRPNFLCFINFMLRFESCLHSNSDRSQFAGLLCIAAKFGWGFIVVCCEVFRSHGLNVELAGL